jgi:hypothetical protein
VFRYLKGEGVEGKKKPFNKQGKKEIMHKKTTHLLQKPQGLKRNKNLVYRKEEEALKIRG